MATKKEKLVAAFLSVKKQIPELVNKCAVPSIEDGIDLLLDTCLCEVLEAEPEPVAEPKPEPVAEPEVKAKPKKKVKKAK